MATPTVELGAFRSGSVRVAPGIIRDLRLGVREGVNASALAVTTDARRRVQIAVGAEQRLSGVVTRKRFDRGGVTRRVTAATRAKGGTRINPYYRPAASTTNPVALVGVRGPAQFIEHPRRGGYQVRPLRQAVEPGRATELAGLSLGGLTPNLAGRLANPALRTPMGPRAAVYPGAIRVPRAPISAAFAGAAKTVERAAVETIRKRTGAR